MSSESILLEEEKRKERERGNDRRISATVTPIATARIK
jgi:hypothetical protein